MKATAFGFLCLVVAAHSLAADPTYSSDAVSPGLRFQKEISASQKPDESLVAVALDTDVYAETQPGFADIRLQDPQGTALPYLLRKSQELVSKSVRRRSWTATKPSLKPLDDGGLEITMELGEHDPQPTGLSLITPLRNFEQRVRVYTSTDGKAWDAGSDETVIFDYSRFMDVRNDRVSIAATSRKHIRVIVDDVTSEQQSELLELTRHLHGNEESDRTERVTIDRRPFRIDRIEFFQEVIEQSVKSDRKRAYPIAGFKAAEDPKQQRTVVTIDTRREPLTSFKLESPSKNFSRSCVIEAQVREGTQTSWKEIGSATLSRIDFKHLKREQLTISFPETRSGQYRLVIDNRDSPPLAVAGIAAEGNVYEVIYLTSANQSLRLAYGDPDALSPSYDTAAIQTLLAENIRPEIVTLGAEQPSIGIKPAGWKLSHLVNDPRMLTTVIGVLVILLGLGLYSTVKRLDADSPPPPPGSPT